MERGEYKNNWYFQSAEHVKLKRIIVFKKKCKIFTIQRNSTHKIEKRMISIISKLFFLFCLLMKESFSQVY